MQRRRFLALGAACAFGASALGRAAFAWTTQTSELDAIDLRLPGSADLARRALVLVPRARRPGVRYPLLVLLHGLGETGNEELGIRAWSERYGLLAAYHRLRNPPLARTLRHARYLTDTHLAELNAALLRQPFRDIVIACPVTPNPYRARSRARLLDRYADWIATTLLPGVRSRVPAAMQCAHTALDGCSLGGYVGLEVFLRKPELFGALGGVQAAIGVAAARRYAARLAETIRRVGPRALHVETSTADPYRKANEALSERLDALGVPNTLSVLPGPHDQPFLREAGTLEMLLWHERQVYGH
jgi:iron(III)-salmochelin esterase